MLRRPHAAVEAVIKAAIDGPLTIVGGELGPPCMLIVDEYAAWDPEILRILEKVRDERLGLHEEDAHYAALAADMFERPRDDR